MFEFELIKNTLGLDTIFSIVSTNCVSQLGKENIYNLSPVSDKTALKERNTLVQQAINLVRQSSRIPVRNFSDIRVLLNKIEPQNSFLESKECLDIQNLLEIGEDVSHFFKVNKENAAAIAQLAEGLVLQKTLLNQLQFTFDSSGNIYDNASKDLKIIRRKLNQLREDVHAKLDHISSKNTEHLQEDFVTLRDGRLVLPVREFSVNKITGIVHGQSSSGATKYVEPMAVVSLNNEIQDLINEEKREIIRILTRISNTIRENSHDLSRNLSILVELDSIQARALYGQNAVAAFPEAVDDHYWFLSNARHPILQDRIGNETVPLNLEMGDDFNILIISGPNAGGKTVTLKTVGLLQLMFQCSIPVPADEGSKFPVCKNIFVQIGDKQSLENDLSTFSSHINGLKQILQNVTENSLVLIDEIGIGTEPSGGAALAIAILEKLNRNTIATLVSTHQNQLKLYASETKGVQNAAMQFDIEHLKPRFILEIGVPGSSFTFDICKRYGLDPDVIEHARHLEGDSNKSIDKLLDDITQKSAFYQDAVRQLSVKQSKLDGLINLYEKNSAELKKNRKQLEKDAKKQAKAILIDANQKIESAIRSIKESNADKAIVKKVRKEVTDFRASLEHKKENKPVQKLNINDLSVGQKVRALNYNIVGNISKVFKNREQIELEREGLKLTINLSDVELLTENGQPLKQTLLVSDSHVPSSISNEIDVRGCEVQEALHQIEGYINSAQNSDWGEVTIIHGKGTGTLRQAIQQFLSKQKNIKGYRTGRYGEGETGVTVVTLR
ncbi:MAG: endonuclease MutS2 [Calditrichaeota bacterium]|nr:endonuclease MutS2 [Calditrichota bacterium]